MTLKFLQFIHDDKLVERFNREIDLERHFKKHVLDDPYFVKRFKTPEAYVKAAEDLAKTPVDHKTIFGYVQNKDNHIRNVKYNKDTGLFTSYVIENGEVITISAFYRSPRYFESERYRYYYDEIRE